MNSHVHFSVVHNSQAMDTTYLFVNGRMDKEYVTFVLEYYSTIRKSSHSIDMVGGQAAQKQINIV